MKLLLYTRDHAMEWLSPTRPTFSSLSAAPYKGSVEEFAQQYLAALDAAQQLHVDGLVVRGLLRASHGGVEGARYVVNAARERGIAVYAAVHFGMYGGFFQEGGHEFQLDTWLDNGKSRHAQHPQEPLLDGTLYPLTRTLCPTLAENQDWLKRGTQWLLREVGVEGIFLEPGLGLATGIDRRPLCDCNLCEKTRAQIEGSHLAIKDLLVIAGSILEAGLQARRDFRLLCDVDVDPNSLTADELLPLRYLAKNIALLWRNPAGHAQQPEWSRVMKDFSNGVSLLTRADARYQLLWRDCEALREVMPIDMLDYVVINGDVGVWSWANQLNYRLIRMLLASGGASNDGLTATIEELFPNRPDARAFLQVVRQAQVLGAEVEKCTGREEYSFLSRELMHLINDISRRAAMASTPTARAAWDGLLNELWRRL